MLRITEHSLSRDAADGRAIVLEGRLVGPWVEELRRVVSEIEPGSVAIDLGAVSFADADGLALLRSLRDSGAHLARPSGFMAALIGFDVDVDHGGDRHNG